MSVLTERGMLPPASPTRQSQTQTDPLLTIDPLLNMAPIQFVGLSLMQGKDPIEGLTLFDEMRANKLGNKQKEQTIALGETEAGLAQSQEQRMQEQAQRQADEFEWEKTQRPTAERVAQLKLEAVEMDLQATQLQMQEARQKLESRGGVDPEITQRVITDATRAAMDMLKDRVGPDGLTPMPPTPDEVIKLRNMLAKDQFATMYGQGEQITPWESYTPEQQASYARDFPDLLKQYYPDVYGRMVMEGRIQ